MSEIDDGGPAFPHENWETLHGDTVASVQSRGGMSLRDYFAAAALNGMFSSAAMSAALDKAGVKTPEVLMSKTAYAFADAMLKARKP